MTTQNLRGRRAGRLACSLTVGLALAGMVILGWAGPASAQMSFQAQVSDTLTLPAGPCANGAYICGTADIAGVGAGTWNMFVSGFSSSQTPCGSGYTATTDFTPVGDPLSTLTLDEAGSLCGLGHDGAAYRGYFAQGPKAWGHPFNIVGTWSVDPSSTGRFAGLQGSGTDLVSLAGAHVAGSYSGSLG